MSLLGGIGGLLEIAVGVASGGILGAVEIGLGALTTASATGLIKLNGTENDIMAGAGIVAGGVALTSGISAASDTSSGFLDNFVSDAKGFVSSLTGAGAGADASAIGNAADDMASQATSELSSAAGATPTDAATLSAASGQGAGAAQSASADTQAASNATGAGAGTTNVNTNPMDNLKGADSGIAPPPPGTPTASLNAVQPGQSPATMSMNSMNPNTDAAGTSLDPNLGANSTATSTDYGANAMDPNAVSSGGDSGSSGIKGMLSKAASFASSPGGGNILGSVIKGIASGEQQQQMMNEQWAQAQYKNQMWANPANMTALDSAVANGPVLPEGYLQRAQRVSSFLSNPAYGPPTQGGAAPNPSTGQPGPGTISPSQNVPASQGVQPGMGVGGT